MNSSDDLARLRQEYEHRKHRLAGSDLYSWFNPANLFTIQQRQRLMLKVLKKHGFSDLSKSRILEMGCGSGGVLAQFLEFGASPGNLFGVDLLFERLAEAHHRLPGSPLINADGQCLPFSSRSFDLVMQFTALSSVLDANIREVICRDMLRVLKPGGLLLWYDFWINPTNIQTRGIRLAEIKRLFPNSSYECHRITLAPPITRRIVPISWILALFLENLDIFNSHYLVVIQPRQDSGV